MDIQEKIYEELQNVKKQTTKNNGELMQINLHLAELNSQTKKNTDKVNNLQQSEHTPGECGTIENIEDKMQKIDNFIRHWPALEKVIYILIGLLILQIPWVSKYLGKIFESLGIMRYFF